MLKQTNMSLILFEGRLKPLEWLTEDITIDDLTEIEEINNG